VSLAKGRPQTNQKPAGQNGRQNGGQTQANLTEDSEVFCAVTVEANLVGWAWAVGPLYLFGRFFGFGHTDSFVYTNKPLLVSKEVNQSS